jgi:tRNA threonylcarbamoyladenosine biosynthesis protein TsaB
MRILSIDTSTSLASVALAGDDTIIAESLFTCDRTLSARLMPEVERLLAMAGLGYDDLDLFAAAVGPGSFTGVRCGVATVQGLALATAKPCIGFSTLAMLAMNFSLASLPVCALLDARKSEVYAALYDCSAPLPAPLIHDCVLSPERLLDLVGNATDKPVIFAGEGAVRYRDAIASAMGDRAMFAPFPHNAGHSANGAALALDAFRRNGACEPAHLLPVYIRPSEAELARKKG